MPSSPRQVGKVSVSSVFASVLVLALGPRSPPSRLALSLVPVLTLVLALGPPPRLEPRPSLRSTPSSTLPRSPSSPFRLLPSGSPSLRLPSLRPSSPPLAPPLLRLPSPGSPSLRLRPSSPPLPLAPRALLPPAFRLAPYGVQCVPRLWSGLVARGGGLKRLAGPGAARPAPRKDHSSSSTNTYIR